MLAPTPEGDTLCAQDRLGLVVNAGHGLTVANVGPIARLPYLHELNIGHAIVADAVIMGLADAVRAMRGAMDRGRARA